MSDPVSRSNRHTRANPCPICAGYDEADRGKGKRCGGFDFERRIMGPLHAD